MDLGKVIPPLEPRAHTAAAAITCGLVAGESLAFFLLNLAAELDLEAIHAVYRQRDPCGEKAYEPRMMVVLLLYAYVVCMEPWSGPRQSLLSGDRRIELAPGASEELSTRYALVHS
jgi:hypothetical protein